jgi:hypothetical protein
MIVQRIVNPQIIPSIRNYTAEAYANRIIPILILIGFVVCSLAFFLLLIFGGIQWITAGGNKQSLEEARNKIINASIGLFILFALFTIVKLINSVFGINLGVF